MKATLRKRIVLRNIPSETQLLEDSHMEAIYAIRILKALVESEFYGSIEVSDEVNGSGQRFSKQFDIWISKDEMI